MPAVGESFVAGGKPFRPLAGGSPVSVFAEIQICRRVLDDNDHGLIVGDFTAQGAVGEVPKSEAGGQRALRMNGSGPIRRASNRAALVSYPTHRSLRVNMDLAPRGLYGVRFYDPKVGFFA